MSAYKDLEALLGGTPLARKAIDAALAEHAHELAERIREHCRITTGPCGCPGADLIDPEVLNGG